MYLKNFDYIIWDWNGTLLDDRLFCLNIINELLVENDLNVISDEKYLNTFRFPVKKFYQAIGFDFSKICFKQIAKNFVEKYEKNKNRCKLKENALQVLTELDNLNKNQFILSAYPQDKLLEIINYHNLSHFFIDIKGLEHHYADSKLDNAKKMMLSNSINYSTAILIGDTNHDLEVSKHLNINCAVIGDGHQDISILRTNKNVVFNDIKELIL